MTREEYLKLVKGSAAFKDMDQATQAKILAAEGAQMENYIKIFTEEHDTVESAKKSFKAASDEAVANFKQEVKVITTRALKVSEAESRKKDEEDSEKLLKQL